MNALLLRNIVFTAIALGPLTLLSSCSKKAADAGVEEFIDDGSSAMNTQQPAGQPKSGQARVGKAQQRIPDDIQDITPPATKAPVPDLNQSPIEDNAAVTPPLHRRQ